MPKHHRRSTPMNFAMLSLLFLLLFSTASYADLTTVDFQSGDSLLVYDSATGLEWLKFSATLPPSTDAPFSKDEAMADLLGTGDIYDGFMLGESAQITTLLINAMWCYLS